MARICKNGYYYPIFKAKTLDFEGQKWPLYDIETEKRIENKPFSFNFKISNDINLKDIMKNSSTSRKRL